MYTGSADGMVHIFGIGDEKIWELDTGDGVVRDLSWHSIDPTLVVGKWDAEVGGINLFSAFL